MLRCTFLYATLGIVDSLSRYADAVADQDEEGSKPGQVASMISGSGGKVEHWR